MWLWYMLIQTYRSTLGPRRRIAHGFSSGNQDDVGRFSFEVRLSWPLIVLILSSHFFGGHSFFQVCLRERHESKAFWKTCWNPFGIHLESIWNPQEPKVWCFCHFSCTELCVLPRIARCTAWRPVQPCEQRLIGWRLFHWLVEGAQNGLIKYKIYRAPLSFTLLFIKFWQGPVCVLIIRGRTSDSELLV